jgi:two-component system sensor histidine kinase DegS
MQTFRPRALANLIAELCDNVEDARKPHETTFSHSAKNRLRYYRVIVAPIVTDSDDILGFAGLIIDTTAAVMMLSEKKSFAERLVQTSEEEQRRISRDIHDSLGQILFALQLEISSAKTLLHKDIDKVEKVLQSSQDKLSTAMNEASSICYRLSPQLLADFGFVEALLDLVHNIQSSGNINVEFEHKWLKRKMSKSLETALFRVSQEALANIMKHAHASNVRIHLVETEDQIRLTITDDGDGFDLQKTKRKRKRGFGLMNMKERIEMMDGTFIIKTEPKSGTKIDITIPIRIKDNHG